jgi:hypothetical protein
MAKKLINLSPKDNYTKIFLETANCDADSSNIKKYTPVFWHNYRNKSEGGLRLTDKGIEFVVEHADIKTYKVEIPKEVVFTPQVFLWLDHYLNSPYYLDRRHVVVISERAAFELYLFNGDVKKFGLSKTLAKRLAQD